MVKTKSPAVAAANWKGAIPRVGAAYKAGIEGTTDWKEKALKGEALYVEAVTQAASEGRRARGIEGVSDAKWKEGALKKGTERITRGMDAGAADYASKMTKVIGVIGATDLPDRTTDVMTNVTQRAGGMAKALSDAKKRGEFQ